MNERSIEGALAQSLTLTDLTALMDELRPQRTIVCAAGDELAVRRAQRHLEAEGCRVNVRVSPFVKLGQAFVIDSRAGVLA